MKRLEPIKTKAPSHSITSVNLGEKLSQQVTNEKIRIGASSRSEVVRLILEAYFEEFED